MKKMKYLAMLLAAGMFAACSDNLEDTGAGNAGGDTPSTTEGYVKVAINMPTTSGNSSRSTDNGESGANVSLEDGEANEYAVQNAIIAFFKATTSDLTSNTPEAVAKFVKAYSFTKEELTISGSSEVPQVTQQVTTITEAPKVADTETLYALVILNYNSDIVSVLNDGTYDGALKIATSTPIILTSTSNNTLADLQKKISVTIDGTTKVNTSFVEKFWSGTSEETKGKQFTMTNAPLSDKQGTSSTISGAKAYTLVPVTVYDDQAAAIAGEVSTIYVERVVAKVTLTSTSTHKVTGNDKQIKVTNVEGTETGDIVEITGWCLNVTNNSTKLVRDVTNFTAETNGWLSTGTNFKPERFAGTRPIENASFGISNESNYYRIYWAQDCNYYGTGTEDVTTVANDFTTYYTGEDGNIIPQAPTWNGNLVTTTADNACYCLENTMDATQQIENRTTGVLIKTKYLTKFTGESTASPKDFFICGANSTKYPKEQIGSGSQNGGTDAFVDYVIAAANTLITNDAYDLSTTNTKGLSLVTELKSGTYTDITKVFTFAETNTSSEKYQAQFAAVQAVVGGRISYYGNDGESFYYYSTLIRHFQDGEGVDIDDAGVASASDYTLQHLGRYGVVRNNWYEIDIQSIGGPGDPTIINPGDEPDDSSEGYMNVAINVLSWAKRSQNVDL